MMKPDKNTLTLSRNIAAQLISSYKPQSKILARIAAYIDNYDKFVLTTHLGSDADGLGSQTGLYYLLKQLGKKVVIINNETVPNYVKFMVAPKVHAISDVVQNHRTENNYFKDAFIFILDSSQLSRSEKVADIFQRYRCDWATIDHHILPYEENFCVDPDYAATCEIIWDLYIYLKVELSNKAALGLYTGIVADTGNFRYPKTSFRTHLAGAHLLSYPINSDYVYRKIYESHSIDRLPLLKRVLERAHINKKLGFVTSEVTHDMLTDLDLPESKSEGIVNLLLAVNDINIAGLMSETDEGELKCSLRSIDNYDVAAIAATFGGGGHKNAAGLKIKKPFQEAKKLLNEEIAKALTANAK